MGRPEQPAAQTAFSSAFGDQPAGPIERREDLGGQPVARIASSRARDGSQLLHVDVGVNPTTTGATPGPS